MQTKLDRLSKVTVGILLLLIVYSVGVVGFLLPGGSEVFAPLTVYNLLFASLVVFAFHPSWSTVFVFKLAVIFFAGYWVEVLGVHTGVIFGSYWYGNTLGLKLFDVPLMIGLNWALLIYCCAVIVSGIKSPLIIQALMGASLMVLLDFFIEPFAVRYDLWSWEGVAIPIQNYLAWYLIAFVMLLFFLKPQTPINNRAAKALYLIQLVFFTVLWAFST